MPAWSHGSLMQNTCATRLDAAVTAHTNGEKNTQQLFEQLKQDCEHLPQVHHNLGVLAAEAQLWDQSIAHFEHAIASDARTNMTTSQLRAIHQYKAAMAYKSALGATTMKTTQPQFRLQDSAITNQSYKQPQKSALHTVPTVDYELYAWWTAARESLTSEWLEHYSPGYPPAQSDDAQTISWNNVARDISFTAQDAVVVLSYQLNNIEKRTLLLMRLQNNRWKIYRESPL